MTRERWWSLSAAVAVGVVAGFAIGVTVGRPAADGPTSAEPAARERGPSAADGEPTLAGSAPASPDADVLRLDLHRDWALAWATLDAMVAAKRVDEVIAAARAIARRDGRPEVLAALGARVDRLEDPAARLQVLDALRGAGVMLPIAAGAELELRTRAGRAAEVLRAGPEVLSAAGPDAFRALVTEATRHGFDEAAVRAVAARDAWGAWRVRIVADALASAHHPAAQAWADWASRVHAEEKRLVEERQASAFAAEVAELRAALVEEATAERWSGLGDTLRGQGADPAGAADAYERALDLDPFAAHAASNLAELAPERLLPRIRERWRELPDDERLTILATTLLRTGHADEATAAFFRCRELDSAWLLAGIASLAPGPALASIDTRLALGDDEALRLARVDALAALGRVPEAREALAPLVTPDSGFAADTWERLLALDPERAITNHGSERATLPPNAEFRVFLGEAFRRVGRGAEAKELVEPFLAGNPDWIGWEFVAPLLAALDPETRLAPLEARARDPDEQDDARPWANLAEAYALLGRTADARRAYDEAIAREPDDMPLRIRRLRVR